MAGTISGINTNFTVPDLPADATPQQSLEFLKAIMLFNIAFHAAETGIETIGKAESSAVSKAPQ